MLNYFGYKTSEDDELVLNATRFLKLPNLAVAISEDKLIKIKPTELINLPQSVSSDLVTLEVRYTKSFLETRRGFEEGVNITPSSGNHHVQLLVAELSRIFLGGVLKFDVVEGKTVIITYCPNFIPSIDATLGNVYLTVSAKTFFSNKGFDQCNHFLDQVVNKLSRKQFNDLMLMEKNNDNKHYSYFTLFPDVLKYCRIPMDLTSLCFMSNAYVESDIPALFDCFKSLLNAYMVKEKHSFFHGWLYLDKTAIFNRPGQRLDGDALGVCFILLDNKTDRRVFEAGTLNQVKKRLVGVINE